MIPVDTKRRAFAAMDHVLAFELHLTHLPPHGDHVVELARGAAVADVLPTARFVRKMAATFFADKLIGRRTAVQEGQPVGFYLVGTLPPLGDDAIEPLDDTWAPPSSSPGTRCFARV